MPEDETVNLLLADFAEGLFEPLAGVLLRVVLDAAAPWCEEVSLSEAKLIDGMVLLLLPGFSVDEDEEVEALLLLLLGGRSGFELELEFEVECADLELLGRLYDSLPVCENALAGGGKKGRGFMVGEGFASNRTCVCVCVLWWVLCVLRALARSLASV